MLSGLPGILGELTTETNHFCSSMKKKKHLQPGQNVPYYDSTEIEIPLMDPNPGVLGPNADFLWLCPLRHVVTRS